MQKAEYSMDKTAELRADIHCTKRKMRVVAIALFAKRKKRRCTYCVINQRQTRIFHVKLSQADDSRRRMRGFRAVIPQM